MSIFKSNYGKYLNMTWYQPLRDVVGVHTFQDQQASKTVISYKGLYC